MSEQNPEPRSPRSVCPLCRGKTFIRRHAPHKPGDPTTEVGAPKMETVRCPRCNGSGKWEPDDKPGAGSFIQAVAKAAAAGTVTVNEARGIVNDTPGPVLNIPGTDEYGFPLATTSDTARIGAIIYGDRTAALPSGVIHATAENVTPTTADAVRRLANMPDEIVINLPYGPDELRPDPGAPVTEADARQEKAKATDDLQDRKFVRGPFGKSKLYEQCSGCGGTGKTRTRMMVDGLKIEGVERPYSGPLQPGSKCPLCSPSGFVEVGMTTGQLELFRARYDCVLAALSRVAAAVAKGEHLNNSEFACLVIREWAVEALKKCGTEGLNALRNAEREAPDFPIETPKS